MDLIIQAIREKQIELMQKKDIDIATYYRIQGLLMEAERNMALAKRELKL